jgi:hypothetical protein
MCCPAGSKGDVHAACINWLATIKGCNQLCSQTCCNQSAIEEIKV